MLEEVYEKYREGTDETPLTAIEKEKEKKAMKNMQKSHRFLIKIGQLTMRLIWNEGDRISTGNVDLEVVPE